MLIKNLTLICASLIVTILASCGGANMNGFISPRKEKTDKSGGREVSEPAVVTGSYLTCDYSPRDVDDAGQDAIGCRVSRADDKNMALTTSSDFQFYRSFNGGSYTKPSLTNSASGWQAVFKHPKSQTSKSKFIVSYANGAGTDEMVCEGARLPCKTQITPQTKPMHLSLTTQGFWAPVNPLISDFLRDPACPNNPRVYCKNGQIIQDSSPKVDTETRCPGATGFLYDTVLESLAEEVNVDLLARSQSQSSVSIDTSKICIIRKPATNRRSAPRELVTGPEQGCYLVAVDVKSGFKINHRDRSSRDMPSGKAFNLIIPDSSVENLNSFKSDLAKIGECK